MDLIDVFKTKKIGDKVSLEGWIRNNRDQKEYGFIDFYDGTTVNTLQIVYTKDLSNFDEVAHYLCGSSIEVEGELVESNGKQVYELKPSKIDLVGACPADYPIQPKRHTMEFLRSEAYLRPRTKTFQAVFKIRSVAAQGIHKYFEEHNYVYVNTPLITNTDCEGENQMFKVTTFDLNNVPKVDGNVDYSKDLFGKAAFITGTGQLHGESFAMAFKKIYTFGPTFRTEKSNTKTHANEFWMIEPEMAFFHLNDLMDAEEEMLKYVVKYTLDKCPDEIDFLDSFVSKGLREKLEKLVDSKFIKITHHDAIDLLLASGEKWEFTPDYESDIAKEHEKWITEHFSAPVFIYNWPKDIKAWYMKLNDDGSTVAAVDLEVPGSGELMGGSERETDMAKLDELIKKHNVNKEQIDWYLNLRRFGSVYHSGFGMGFERLIMYLTGIENIRDVIPFPRTPGSCEY
ncbi:MAG TPA: asparagine--tRNA ligase [Bacilli bacterium]|jgi:asparaginyl-tRNA synthetase|nr:asparagine--tRNA ligase [Bacilli bacterium]HPZ23867.1 asparagine--tRNA ligase [Bacilli bacterium]HQC84036.1 asparagine--tRNA ligase [Bacilli bacterium]